MNKELSELTLEELWILFPIILEKHNNEYFKWYADIKLKILECIDKSNCTRISHIGSSAVKGLISKPTVDILLEITNNSSIDTVSKKLSDNGWILMNSTKTPNINYVFNKGYTKYGFADKVYHLHVRNVGDWDELYFRDYLIDNKSIANEYANLKLSLIKKFKNNRYGYTDAKTEFIKEKTTAARLLYGNKHNIAKTTI